MRDETLVAGVPVQSRRGQEPDVPPLAAALLAAADADAGALADRLHDGALQSLVVARYAADAAVRGGDAVLARDAVQEALVALRHVLWELRPRGADALPAALAELSQRRAEPLLLDAVDPDVCARLHPAARAAAYRFVQTVLPAEGPAGVAVTREGDGAVVDAGGAPEDVTGWTARASALGGSLDVSGPTARLLLPLAAPNPDPEDPR